MCVCQRELPRQAAKYTNHKKAPPPPPPPPLPTTTTTSSSANGTLKRKSFLKRASFRTHTRARTHMFAAMLNYRLAFVYAYISVCAVLPLFRFICATEAKQQISPAQAISLFLSLSHSSVGQHYPNTTQKLCPRISSGTNSETIRIVYVRKVIE